MVSYGDVRRWQAEPLHESVGALNALCNTLIGLSDEAAVDKTNRWHGEAASAAANSLWGIRVGLEDLVSEVAAMRTAMAEAADSVSGLEHGVADAESLAGRYCFRIEDNGILTDTAGGVAASEPEEVAWQREREPIRVELADRVKEIIRRAEDLDDDLFAVVSRCLERGGVGNRGQDNLTEAARAGGDAGHLSMLEPPQGGTAAANAAWWSTVGDGGKAWLLANHPEWVGNLDGVPAADRDKANRMRIPLERARLQAEREAYLADPKHRYVRQDGYYGIIHSPEFDRIEAKLSSLVDIEEMLKRPDRHLLVLDTTGERAKAAVAVGDVDTADHVAVFTPGMNSTVNDRMEGYDKDMGELRDNAERELEANGREGVSVAAVTWLNYEPPHSDVNPQDVAGTGKADEGARRLASFLNGIDASRVENPHLSALGHSYGSLTTGIAVRDYATGVDEVAVFGSPGLGVDDTAQLKAPQGHVYNLEAEGDIVADVGDISKNVLPPDQWGWHGRDPGGMPGMRQLSTDDYIAPDGTPLVASHGHSEYLRAEDGKYSTSEWNLANIVGGTGIIH